MEQTLINNQIDFVKMILDFCDTSKKFKEFCEYREQNRFWDFVEELRDEAGKIGITFNAGCTKAVIISECNDYVIKIPFEGETEDYCARELEIYNEAKKTGIAQMFAEIEFLGTFYGLPIYLMEKLDANEDDGIYSDLREICIKSNGMDEHAASSYLSAMESNEIVREYLDYCYDYDLMREFDIFCADHSVNDVHEQNVGFKNGKLMLLDYSGYCRVYSD